jgi:hypothetical protein
MKFNIIHRVNRVLKKFGYSLRNNRELYLYPYIKVYNFLDTKFDFWITEPTARKWYDHDFWNKAVEFITIKKMLKPSDSVLEFGLHYGLLEGYEVQVLEGCRKILRELPKIAIELHLDSIPSHERAVEDLFKLISINKYQGQYFWNPGTAYIRPDSHQLLALNLDDFPKYGIVNLFLKPI